MQQSHAGGLYVVRNPDSDAGSFDFYGTSSLQVRNGVTITTIGIDRMPAARIELNDETLDRVLKYQTMSVTEDRAKSLADLDLRTYDRIGPVNDSDTIEDEELQNLAAALLDDGEATGAETVRIPAAYTYFGQFLAHDMTRMEIVPAEPDTPAAVYNLRPSQVLDFSTLFDLDPAVTQASPHWQDSKGAWLGEVSGYSGARRDLPRLDSGAPATKDFRSDANLAMSQMHVLMARYHMALVATDPQPDDAAQQALTVQRLQSVVLHDYLHRIITKPVYDDIMEHGRRLIEPATHDPKPDFQVSVEFAAACFRFGHSMVRRRYDPWNSFNTAEIQQLLRYAHNRRPELNGTSELPPDALSPQRRLAAGWTQTWRKFVDGADAAPAEVMAAPIDSRVATAMGSLPARLLPDNEIPPQAGAVFSLAFKTLDRGRALQLSSAGQMIARIQSACANTPSAATVVALPENEIDIGATNFGFGAPLWFYTLREAEKNNGQLGPIAGRIVMETLHAAIELAPVSILKHEDGKTKILGAHVTLRDVVEAANGQ